MRIQHHDNRLYPPPGSPWVMAMTWLDLLFMHWRVGPEKLRAYVPPGLDIETFDGSAWLGVVPFEMLGTRARLTPPVPGISRFPELNVRTYVRGRASGRPGVWFFSLDAARPLAVTVARRSYHLAYMNAAMSIGRAGARVEYASRRTGPNRELSFGPTRSAAAEFVGTYAPSGPARIHEPGTLESFVTDRYCLYAWRRGGLLRGEIHHAPWPLQPAEAEVRTNTMGAQLGLDLASLGEPMLHYAARMDVRGWWPVREG